MATDKTARERFDDRVKGFSLKKAIRWSLILVGIVAAVLVIFWIKTYKTSADAYPWPMFADSVQDFDPLLIPCGICFAVYCLFAAIAPTKVNWFVRLFLGGLPTIALAVIYAQAGQWWKTVMIVLGFLVVTALLITYSVVEHRNWERNVAKKFVPLGYDQD